MLKFYYFIKGVQKLIDNKEDITYYNLKKLGLPISNRSLLECLEFCDKTGFLWKNTFWRKGIRVSNYKRRFNWYKLKNYILDKYQPVIENRNKNKQEKSILVIGKLP